MKEKCECMEHVNGNYCSYSLHFRLHFARCLLRMFILTGQ